MSANSTHYKTLVREIDSYLKDEDLKVNSDNERLSHLWSLLQQTKSNLTSAVDNIDVLRLQFTNERKDFEGYVEHITTLSDEREARALEYEAENQELKEQIHQLNQKLASFDNSETRDMLRQAGLNDIIHVRPSAQIAYLLVERARLMDILEEWQNVNATGMRNSGVTPLNIKSLGRQRDTNEKGLAFDRTLGSTQGFNGRLPITGLDNDDITETSWSKLKELLDKVDSLEADNIHLMQRMKELAPDEYEQFISSQATDYVDTGSGFTSNRPKVSDFVPKRPFVPPKNLDEAIVRLQAAEEKEAEMELLRLALKEKTLEHLNNDEESFASLLGSPRGGLATRELEKHNAELQNAMSAVDNHLQQLASDSSNVQVQGGMASKLSVVQQEFERVKVELVKMMEKYKVQYRKYADHKLAVKNRVHVLKENFRQERRKLTEEIEALENDLALVKVTLQKENEYKDNMEKSHHTLLLEQQELQIKLSEQEQLTQERTRELAIVRVQTQCLEDENDHLRQQIDNHGKPKSVYRIIEPQGTNGQGLDNS